MSSLNSRISLNNILGNISFPMLAWYPQSLPTLRLVIIGNVH